MRTSKRSDGGSLPQQRGLTRREMIASIAGAAAFTGLAPSSALAKTQVLPDVLKIHAEFPSHDPAVVRKVVATSHADFETLKKLVSASPALAKVAWDWGFGDWESALGASSHMGRRDIAEFLMGHGARPDLFTFAMLGQVDVVRSYIVATPGIQGTLGPHGINLLQHAQAGGDAADSVVAYLEEVGGADPHATSLALTDEKKEMYLGRYVFGKGDNDALEVIRNRGGDLTIKRGGRFGRVLNRVEEHGFAPGGAPAVRVRFQVIDNKAVSLSIHDPGTVLSARRAG